MGSRPGILRAVVDLPPAARSAAAARRLVAQVLHAWSAEAFHDDAVLLVSELVSNVVRHVAGGAAMRVEVRLAGPGLHVAVVDSSAALPALRPGGPLGGHGLGLVSVVADRWGSEELGGGKRVWFELGPSRSA
jgi:anti-sigma regulatory factor (Ser/Thr protein kinase)